MTHADEMTGDAAAGAATDLDDAADGAPRRSGAARVAVLVAAAVALVAVGVVGYSVGRLSTLADPTPATTSAEAGFARDMQEHHRQGVELAMIVRDLTDDPEVRLLAYDIATTQAQQSGQMYGWLNEWGVSQAGSEPSMTWMTRPAAGDEGESGGSGHGAHSGAGTHEPGDPMPGLATPEQVDELEAASGVEAERIFLELMIAHHEGAAEMADAALARSSYPVVARLAQSIVDSQPSEIRLMERMLAERS